MLVAEMVYVPGGADGIERVQLILPEPSAFVPAWYTALKFMSTLLPALNPGPLTVIVVPAVPLFALSERDAVEPEDVEVDGGAPFSVMANVAVALLPAGLVAVTVYVPRGRFGTWNVALIRPNIPGYADPTCFDSKVISTRLPEGNPIPMTFTKVLTGPCAGLSIIDWSPAFAPGIVAKTRTNVLIASNVIVSLLSVCFGFFCLRITLAYVLAHSFSI